MARTLVVSALVVVAVNVLAAGSARACERVDPGSCGSLTAEVKPMPPMQMGDMLVPQPGSFQVILKWSAAENLDAPCKEGGLDEGSYDPWSDSGGGTWMYKPFDMWNSRSLTYTWYVFDRDPHGVMWQFRVRGVGSFAEGPYSNTSVWIPPFLKSPPRVTLKKGSGRNSLTWDAPAGRADESGQVKPIKGYEIWRATKRTDNNPVKVADVVNGTSWEDSDLLADDDPSYSVYAYDDWGLGSSKMAMTEEEQESLDKLNNLAFCGSAAGGPMAGLAVLALALLRRRRV